MSDTFDVDDQLEAVERFIQQVQAGEIGTSEAMAAYRDQHRPAIARLREELDAFRALLEEDVDNDPAPSADHAAAPTGDVPPVELPPDDGGGLPM